MEDTFVDDPCEFRAYRILFSLLHDQVPETLMKLPKSAFKDSRVQQALSLCVSVVQSNYFRFFQLIAAAPSDLWKLLLADLVEKMRKYALQSIIKSYRIHPVPLSFLQIQMGFEDQEELVEYLNSLGAILDKDGKGLLCKETANSIAKNKQ